MKTQVDIRQMSSDDFLSFGMRNVAYIREVERDAHVAYSIHAADGTPISVIKDLSRAVDVLEDSDLCVVTLQ